MSHPSGEHPNDVVQPDGWPSGESQANYEPAGPWEPISYDSTSFKFMWRRPYREKKSDLEKLATAKSAVSNEEIEELERMAKGVLRVTADLRSIRGVLEQS